MTHMNSACTAPAWRCELRNRLRRPHRNALVVEPGRHHRTRTLSRSPWIASARRAPAFRDCAPI